jgi:hypothetical protein
MKKLRGTAVDISRLVEAAEAIGAPEPELQRITRLLDTMEAEIRGLNNEIAYRRDTVKRTRARSRSRSKSKSRVHIGIHEGSSETDVEKTISEFQDRLDALLAEEQVLRSELTQCEARVKQARHLQQRIQSLYDDAFIETGEAFFLEHALRQEVSRLEAQMKDRRSQQPSSSSSLNADLMGQSDTELRDLVTRHRAASRALAREREQIILKILVTRTRARSRSVSRRRPSLLSSNNSDVPGLFSASVPPVPPIMIPTSQTCPESTDVSELSTPTLSTVSTSSSTDSNAAIATSSVQNTPSTPDQNHVSEHAGFPPQLRLIPSIDQISIAASEESDAEPPSYEETLNGQGRAFFHLNNTPAHSPASAPAGATIPSQIAYERPSRQRAREGSLEYYLSRVPLLKRIPGLQQP